MRAAGLIELHRQHRAQPADLGDLRHRALQAVQFFLQQLAQAVGAVQQLFFGDDVDHRQRRGHRQRVAGIGPAQAAGGGSIHQLGPAGQRGQRETAGQRFGHGDQVGLHRIVLHREQLAGAGETGLHFVGDQQDAVLVANLAQPDHPLAGRDVETAFALHRLKDDGGDAFGVDVVLEQLFQPVQGVFHGHAVQRVGIGSVIDVAGEGAEAHFVRDHLAGQRHAQQGAAVEGPAEGDHPGAAGGGARHFYRVFHCFGAGGEQRGFLRVLARRQLVQPLGKTDIGFVRDNLIAGVTEPGQLFGDRGLYFVMQMAGIQYANAAGEIDIAFTVGIPDFGILGALGKEAAHHAHAARGGVGLALHQILIAHLLSPRRCAAGAAYGGPPRIGVGAMPVYRGAGWPLRGLAFIILV